MSKKVVDTNVVEMQFDNRNFEKNVATSMSTLDKLKAKLSFKGASDGLDEVGRAAKNVDLSPLQRGAEAVKVKFSTLEVVAMAALSRITNSVISAGEQLVSSFTIDPVKSGLNEYETQINSIQTILANTKSKGSTLDDVNNSLAELNKYADLTIYNFTEMTRNIGTFTAAGVGLKDSTKAIQGIANLAAVSGSNAQQAATAMYQLSQALASGSVKLQDWNSVVNAGMGGETFQNALKETARAHGVAVDKMIKDTGSFRESLKEGWITSEIMIETLSKMTKTGAAEYLSKLTGISQKEIETQQALVDANKDGTVTYDKLAASMAKTGKITKENAISILEMADTATNAATKVKTFRQLLETLKEAAQSGWAQTWQIIFGDFEQAKELFTEASDYFGNIISESAKARNEVLQGWKDLGGRDDLIDSLRNVFEGILSISKPIKEAFREIFPPVTDKKLANFTKGLKELTSHLKVSDDTAEKIKSTFKGVFAVFDIGVEAFKAIGKGAITLIKSISVFSGTILDASSSVGDFLVCLRDTIVNTDMFGEAIDKAVGFLTNIISKIKEFGKSVNIGFNSSTLTGFFGVLEGIWNLITSIGSKVGSVFASIGSYISDAFGKGDIFEVLDSGIFAAILLTVRKFVGGVSNVLKNANGVLKNITGILDDVRKCFQAYQEQLKAGTLLKIAAAIGILATSIFVISTIDGNALARSLAGITVLFAELLGSLDIFTKISTNIKGVTKSISAMIGMSVAILILAGAMKKLSSISWEGIAKGLVGVGALMVELALFMNFAKFNKKIKSSSIGIVILASSMLILANAVEKFGGISWEEIGKGLASIAGLLTELAIFTNVTGNAKHVISTGTAMVLLGASMKIFASAMKDFSSMKWEEIGKGLAAIGGALAEVTIALQLIPKNTLSIGLGLIAVSAAMTIMANTLSSFGGMSWKEIGKGLVSMGGALAELAIALNLMNGTLSGSAALIIAAGALAIIAPVMKLLGDMSWEQIGKGLITLAGAFSVVGIAGALLSPLIPAILGLSAAFALLGIATLGIGAGLLAISAAFTALATAGTAGATAIVAAITVIVVGLADLIPTLAEKFGEAIVAFAVVIGEFAPQLAESFLKLISSVLESLATYIPQIIDSLITLLIGIINGLADNMPSLITAAVNLIGSLLRGIVDALSGIDAGNILKGIVAIGLMTGLMYALSGVTALIPSAMVGVLGLGAVVAELALVLAAIGALAQIPGLQWLVSDGGNFLQVIGTAIGQFIGGIIGGVAEGVMSGLPGIGKDLSDFMTNAKGFITGIEGIDPSVTESAKNLASALLIICGANILSAITSWLVGDNDMAAFGGKLKQFGQGLVDFSDTVKGRIDADAVSAAASAGKLITELADSIPNSGGLVGFLVGNNDVDTFGGKLKKFAEGLVDFSSTVKGKIDSESVKTATEAGNLITKLADSVPNSGGLVGFLVGNNDVDTFGGKLKKFAEGLVDFSDTVKGKIDSESVRTATDAGTLVTQLAKTVPKSGGWVEKILGKSDMEEFSDNLKSFGDGLVDFCNSDLQNVKIATIETISRELGSILTLIKNITAFNAVNISSFTTNMEAIAETSIDGFIEAFTGSSQNVSNAVSGFLTVAYNATKSLDLQFYTAGINAATGFINGIQLEINNGNVYAAGYSIGDTAYNAAKKALDEHSPSKKMKKVGAYAIEGFVKGISNGKVKIAKVTDAVFKKFIASAVSATNVSKYAKGAINKYANSFSKHAGKTKKAMSEAMKTIRAYYTVLYKQSDYYKNDKKNLSDHVKQLRKYYSERTKLSASLSKALAKHDQSNIKNTRKSLKENLKNINKLKKQIESDKKKMANNAKKAWNDAKKEIKTAVKEYIDIFNTAADSIDLFSESDMSGATTAISSLKESLKELTSLSNFSLDPGINMLEQFSSAASNSADSVKSATDELAEAKEDLASAEKELLEYQTKSLAVNGRSQKYLDKIKELEEKVAESKKKVASAEETLADASKSSSQEMLDNMKSNVEGYEAWRKDLEALSKSGISDELMSYLKGLGISGAEQVAAFAKMTKEELSQANDYWSKYSSISSKTFTDGLKEKSDAMIKWGEDVEKFANLNIDSNVKAQLLKEFQTQGVDSDEYIRNILSMNASELKDFVDSYSEMMNVPEQVAKKVSESIDAVTKKASSSTDAMASYIDRMRENLKAEQDYQENLKKLKSNGISSGLYDQLVSNGDKTLIASFANASKEEIDQANQIFKESAKQSADNWLNEYGDRIADEKTWANNMKKLTKLNIPKKMKEELYKEFSNKGVEGNDTLELILGMDKDQLKRFVSKYGKGGKETNNIANTILAGAASVSSAAEKEMKNSASKAAASAMKAMNGSVSNSAPEAKKAGKKVGSAAVKGIKTYVNHTKGKNIGKNMTDGMASGLKSGKNKVTSAAIKVAKEAYNGAKNYLKIKSPSRKFKELAMYCVKGMANGLNEYSGLSSDAAVQMSEDIVNRMQSAINAVNMMAQSGVDAQPTIRPVYDMSELESQASQINDLLGAGSIGVSADMASSVARHMSAAMSNQNGVTTNNSYDQSMHASNYNTFNITSNNPKEVANEVSKILQNQVNRRETIWA